MITMVDNQSMGYVLGATDHLTKPIVQPSVQYLVNPAGNKSVPNALAIGVNVLVQF
jgi:carbohydrate-selective porin OprB